MYRRLVVYTEPFGYFRANRLVRRWDMLKLLFAASAARPAFSKRRQQRKMADTFRPQATPPAD